MAESIKLKNDRYWDSKGVYDSTKGASQEDVNKTIIASHVGQVIMTTTLDTEEKVIAVYGGSSWSKIEGRFLLGASSSYPVNSTGGSTTMAHTHSVTASGTVGNTTLAQSQIPNYKIGDLPVIVMTDHQKWNNGGVTSTQIGNASASKPGLYHNVGGSNTNSMQYGWTIKTNGGGGAHNHGFTGTAVTSGAASNTNIMPPYKAVYIWERTA